MANRFPVFPDKMTIGEAYDPTTKITDQAEADEYFERLLERNMRVSGHSREEAEKVEKSNIGYYAGYCETATAERMFRLFRCAHPIFGTTRPTLEEAFKKGMEMGEKAKRERQSK